MVCERSKSPWSRLSPTALCLALAIPCAAPANAADPVLARDESGTELSREAVSLCLDAGETSRAEKRAALLERGLEVAERAVATHERDAKAHFAVFCTMLKQ